MKTYQNLYLRGRVWHYEFERNGTRFRGSTNTHLVREAMAVVRQKIDEAEDGQVPTTERKRDGSMPTVSQLEAWDLNRSRLAANHRNSDGTIHSIWKRIATYFHDAAEVTDDSVAAYARHMLTQGYSSATIKRDLWALRRAYAWAAPAANLPALMPMPKLAVTPKNNTAGRLLSHEELNGFLSQLKGRALAHAIIGVTTGIRREELERAQQSWLELETMAKLSLPEGMTKGGKPRWVPLTILTYGLARLYLPLKEDPRQAWRTAARRAGIENVAMRDLRHTFASRMSRYDSDAARIICGWKTGDNNASMFYQHLDEERAKNIIGAIPLAFPYLEDHARRAF